ncbi:MAG: PilT/PilU family type 4a pilus ATPase [Candidatus Falkowbacteria bacterium]
MDFKSFFKGAIEKGASDVHLVVGSKPCYRIDSELVPDGDETITEAFMEKSLAIFLAPERIDDFNKNRELDFGVNFFEHRFRVNLHFQEGQIGLAARLIRAEIPTADELGFTEAMSNLTRLKDGLILVTGPSGSGKSTTLAAMIGMINESRHAHIITVEDPIEYLFDDKLSIVEQREVGSDTLSFAAALKYILRQDPNVIMIGEMRDPETIAAALTAAETGHLVLSTLHTNNAPETVARIVDSFPSHRRRQILAQMSMAMRAVIAQTLIPKSGGGLVAAREIMINNQAVANLIRENKVNQLATVIKTNYQMGMIDMNKSIDVLNQSGLVDEMTTARYKRNLETKSIYL